MLPESLDRAYDESVSGHCGLRTHERGRCEGNAGSDQHVEQLLQQRARLQHKWPSANNWKAARNVRVTCDIPEKIDWALINSTCYTNHIRRGREKS